VCSPTFCTLPNSDSVDNYDPYQGVAASKDAFSSASQSNQFSLVEISDELSHAKDCGDGPTKGAMIDRENSFSPSRKIHREITFHTNSSADLLGGAR